jgi:signal transduction histidine kinase
MRERVRAHGGTLSAAPEPAGGFAVVATLPLGDRA